MSILKEHVSHMEREQLKSHQSELTAFFLTALDFRAQHCQVRRSQAPPLYRHSAVSLILTLSCF